MLFSSSVFLFIFLPILCAVYFFCNKKWHNTILLIASLLFYAWGEPKFLAIMLLSIFINWLGAVLIDKFSGKLNLKKFALISTITLNLSILIYFKYFNFLIENFNNIFHGNISLIKIILPLGISFYTFQALSYVIDVFRGECKAQKNIFKLALYICLFPQLIAGPIVKYHDIAEQIDSREVNFEKVSEGVKRFIIGLSKKMLIANTMGAIANEVFSQNPDDFSPLIAWLGTITYSFQIYYDFSGYSDMAIGLCLIFGFRIMENFNYPYISKSITEFWRRWHISLSTWFKQYVYIPLGGNKYGRLKQFRNLGIVFLLTGIWHGAAWNFIIWGIWNGALIIMEKLTGIADDSKSAFANALKHIYFLTVLIIGWVIFRAEDLKYAKEYLLNMIGCLKLSPEEYEYTINYYIGGYEIIIILIALICAVPVFRNMINVQNKLGRICVNIWLLVLFILCSAAIATDTYNPFIYFRF